MSEWLPIQYRDFHDVPRMVFFKHGTGRYLLDCPFDDARDAYPEQYIMYRLGEDADESRDDWRLLTKKATEVGSVAVAVGDVDFDATKRAFVDIDSLRKLLR